MKNILFFLTALVLFFGCGKQNKYTLRGSFSGDQNEEYIYLVKFMDSNPQIDSAKIENGRFVFKGNIDFPEVFGLHYNIDRIAGICPVFLEPCEIDVVNRLKSVLRRPRRCRGTSDENKPPRRGGW